LRARVPINISQDHLASELVAHHLSWCVRITEDRYSLTTFAPSEPLIADAAAELMNANQLLEQVLYQYALASFEGLVNVGEGGEIVAQLIFLLSRDRIGGVGYITVDDLINKLLKNECYQKFKEYSTVVSNFKGKEDPMNGKVSFNHFCRVNDTVSLSVLVEFFARGAAIVCKKNQKGVDLVIPVLMGDTLIKENMTFILVQVKNYFKSADTDYPSSAIMDPDVVIDDFSGDHMYFSLYMNVGSSENSINMPEDHAKNITGTNQNQNNWNAERITIALHGMDSEFYPSLQDRTILPLKEAPELKKELQQLVGNCIGKRKAEPEPENTDKKKKKDTRW
jgi:hypothetical protein